MGELVRSMFGTGAGLAALIAAGAASAQSKVDEAAADRWAAETEAKLIDDERFALIHGFMALKIPGLGDGTEIPWPADVVPGAGYIAGVPRLGIPSLRETDASLVAPDTPSFTTSKPGWLGWRAASSCAGKLSLRASP